MEDLNVVSFMLWPCLPPAIRNPFDTNSPPLFVW